MENISKVVKAAGFELADIVSVTVYLTDINEFDEMNKVYRRFLPDPKPTRATVRVEALYDHAQIKISAITVRKP